MSEDIIILGRQILIMKCMNKDYLEVYIPEDNLFFMNILNMPIKITYTSRSPIARIK